MLVRVGSRGSRLALTQAERAVEALRRPGVEIALVPITTAGDRDRTRPFGEIGSRGVFVKELEEALLEGRIDAAVHSAKDMTSTDTAGLVVGAYPSREDARDALCGAAAIEPGMRIGTASVRRRAQLLALEPSLSVEPLRGNVDTRLRKRVERGLDAVVLAACGLDRLGLGDEIGIRLEPDVMLPEAGQGALAMQVRVGEEELVAVADDPETRRRVEAERRCVAVVGGGCLAPVAAHHDGVDLDCARRGRGRDVDRAGAGRRSRGAGPRARGPRAMTLAAGRTRGPSPATPSHTRPTDGTHPARPRPYRFGPRGRVGAWDGNDTGPWRASSSRAPPDRRPRSSSGSERSGTRSPTCRSSRSSRSATTRSTSRGTTGSSSRARTARASFGVGCAALRARVAAIGEATADAFGGADLVAETSTQEGLLDALPEAPGRVLFAAAEGARRLLPDALDADVVALYRTVELEPADWPDGDLVVLVSPSAARALARVTCDACDLDRAGDDPRGARRRPDGGRRGGRSDLDGVVAAVEEALAAP